jgi:pyruvate dehydrogenase E2 component (dihydrolipoamide acetyltransferase)
MSGNWLSAGRGWWPRRGWASCLSNLGQHRVDDFTAIIPPGQSSVLAVGRVALRPFAVEKRLELRHTVRLCLAVDHRVLDGAPAAALLEAVVAHLENPQKLMDSCVSA